MQLSNIAPKKFSTRLIIMALVSGLIPVIIIALLVGIFASRLPVEIDRAIQQGLGEQWQRSEPVLRKMAEDSIRQKALDVAMQLDLYLQANFLMTVTDLQNDPEFIEIAIQPVGRTGYTAVQDSDTAVNRFHNNPGIENTDLHSLSDKLSGFWSIMEASLGGKYSSGYYIWEEPDGETREKFMFIVPLSERTAEGVRLGVAATTYIDEFTRPIQAAQDISRSTTLYIMTTINRLIQSFRTIGFLLMGLGILLVLAFALWMGIYLSRAITRLREATRSVNHGNFDVQVKTRVSGDMGELIEDFNRMVDQLSATTVKKELLELSEKELKKSEKRFRTLAEDSPFAISIMGPDRYFRYFNPKFTEIFGYTIEDLPDKDTWFKKAYPDEKYQKHVVSAWKEDLIENAKPWQIKPRIFTVRCKDGRDKIIHFRTVALEDGAQFVTYEDITDRTRIEEELRESEDRFRSIVENSHEGILVADDVYCLIYANDELSRILAYPLEEIVGQDFRTFMDDESKKLVSDIYIRRQKGELVPPRHEFSVLRKDGERRHVEISSSVIKDTKGKIKTVSQLLDITERKRAEEEKKKIEFQLQQAQKMEAVGTLAGGIAHDFNNLLMVMQGNTSLMLLNTDSGHQNFQKLKKIEELIQSGAGLSKQLLGFARGGKYEVKPTDMNEFVKKSSRMFGRTKKEIKIFTKFQKDLWTVEVDQGQIEQVLLNLYVNAWQAMPDGGELYLQTENVILDENYVKPFDFKYGKYTKISVTDTGIGMDEETRRRIFEPFFTTKGMGRGTGLGLASAYGIIKNHNGTINVYSEKGQGTTFNIYLPASDKDVIEEKIIPEEDILKGEGLILFVDDEEIIVDIGEQMVKELGYKVLIAGNGKQAIEVYKANREKIDMVILDMVMPDMGGGETYDRLKEIDPDIKVLLSSGYSINGQATRILERGCDGFIQKPFSMKDLSEKIKEVLRK